MTMKVYVNQRHYTSTRCNFRWNCLIFSQKLNTEMCWHVYKTTILTFYQKFYAHTVVINYFPKFSRRQKNLQNFFSLETKSGTVKLPEKDVCTYYLSYFFFSYCNLRLSMPHKATFLTFRIIFVDTASTFRALKQFISFSAFWRTSENRFDFCVNSIKTW